MEKDRDREKTSPRFFSLCNPTQAPDLWMKMPSWLDISAPKDVTQRKLSQNQGPRHMTPVKLSNLSPIIQATTAEAQSWWSRDEPSPVFFIFILSSQSPDYNNMVSIVSTTAFWNGLLYCNRYLEYMSWSFLTVLKPRNSFYPYSGRMLSLAYFQSPFES